MSVLYHIAMMGLGLVLPIERTASGGTAPPAVTNQSYPGTMLQGM